MTNSMNTGNTMQAQKLSISLSIQQYEFIKNYQLQHHCKTRSEVIKKALYILQQMELENSYRQASQEPDTIQKDFDITTADGIDNDETW